MKLRLVHHSRRITDNLGYTLGWERTYVLQSQNEQEEWENIPLVEFEDLSEVEQNVVRKAGT